MIRAIDHFRRRPLAGVALLVFALLPWSAPATAQQPMLTGSVTWESQLPVPESAQFEATVLDVTRLDPELIGRVRIRPVQGQPLHFSVPYDPALVKPGHRYTIQARIVDGGEVLFETARPAPVFAGGEATRVSLNMPAGPSSQTTAALPAPPDTGSPGITGDTGLPPPPPSPGVASGSGFGTTPLPPPPGADSPSYQQQAGQQQAGQQQAEPRPLSPPGASPQPDWNQGTGGATTQRGFGGTDAPIRRIRGMYRGMPDGARFVECGDSRPVGIATTGDDARLATAYARTQPRPGQAMLVEVEGNVGIGPLPNRNGLGRVLTVDRFVGIRPGQSCEASFSGTTGTTGTAGTAAVTTPAPATSAPRVLTSEEPAEPLLSNSWQLLSIGTQTIDPSVIPEVPRLQFNSDLPVFSGTDGCNGVRGEYTVIEDSLTLNLGRSTKMACPGSDELGRAFREALERTSTFGITGDHLTLYDAGGTALARFTARDLG